MSRAAETNVNGCTPPAHAARDQPNRAQRHRNDTKGVRPGARGPHLFAKQIGGENRRSGRGRHVREALVALRKGRPRLFAGRLGWLLAGRGATRLAEPLLREGPVLAAVQWQDRRRFARLALANGRLIDLDVSDIGRLRFYGVRQGDDRHGARRGRAPRDRRKRAAQSLGPRLDAARAPAVRNRHDGFGAGNRLAAGSAESIGS